MAAMAGEHSDDGLFDVAVIGGGASGLSAALVLARSRRRVLLIDAGAPRNRPAQHVHGYLGHDGSTVQGFHETAREEVRRHGVTIIQDTVARVVDEADDDDGSLSVEASLGARFRARRILFATGVTDVLPEIPGIEGRWGRDVFGCPSCHGLEYADRVLGVIGRRFDWLAQCLRVQPFSRDIVLFAADDFEATADDVARAEAVGVRAVLRPVRELVLSGDGGALVAVTTDEGEPVPCDALFVDASVRPNDALMRAAGAATRHTPVGDWVTVDQVGRTSSRNIWATGNVVDPGLIAIGAAGAGAQTALAINGDLLYEDLALLGRR